MLVGILVMGKKAAGFPLGNVWAECRCVVTQSTACLPPGGGGKSISLKLVEGCSISSQALGCAGKRSRSSTPYILFGFFSFSFLSNSLLTKVRRNLFFSSCVNVMSFLKSRVLKR